MSTKNETPLWLELRKEYIDDNFEKLLPYLRESSSKLREDVFYKKTINLLQERVAELSLKLASVPIYEILTFFLEKKHDKSACTS